MIGSYIIALVGYGLTACLGYGAFKHARTLFGADDADQRGEAGGRLIMSALIMMLCAAFTRWLAGI